MSTVWSREWIWGLIPHLTKSGIQFKHCYAYVHQQNGRSERKHRHIVETGLTLLAHASMSMIFWWLAFDIVVFLINRMQSAILDFQCPYQLLFYRLPLYSSLKVLGCTCFPYLRDYNRHKLSFYSSKCVFVGYSLVHKGNRCLSS